MGITSSSALLTALEVITTLDFLVDLGEWVALYDMALPSISPR